MAIKPTYDELEKKIKKLEELEAERKRAGEMTLKEEFRYRTLFEAANDSIFIMEDYKFVECNKKTLKMFGCENEKDILGFYPWDFAPPNQPDGRTSNQKAKELMKAALDGKAQSFYWKHIQKGGREFDAEVSLNRLSTQDTNLLLAIVRDITDRKQAERALQDSEATLKSIFRAAPTGIGMVVDRIIKQANDRLCEMLGYSPEELLNKSSSILYPTDEDFIFVGQEKYKQIRMQGTGTVETQWQKKDGTVIDVLLSSTPIDTDDLSAGVTFTALDITDRKRSEEALLESEERYRAFFEQGPDGVVILDPETAKIIQFNDQACRQLGYSRKEFSLLRVPDIEAMETAEETKARIQKVLKEGYDDFETLQITKQGEIRHIHVTAQIIKISGRPLYHCIWRDITERKQAEEALRESETRYRMLFNSTNDAILVYQQNIDGITGKFIEVNDVACRMYSYTREELSELNPFDIITSEQNKNAHIQLKKILSEGYSVFEIVHKDKHGKEFPVEVNSHVFDFYGKQTIVSIVRDISDRKRIEQERLNLEANLTQAQRIESIGVLAGGIAHDFNNILSPILANAEMVMMDLPPHSPSQENLQQIYKAGERAKDLVKQILTFARKTDEDRIPLKISQIIKETVKFLRSTIPSTINIQYDFKTSQDTVLADPTQMNQIIMNLCTNAFHAMKDKGGTLRLTLDNNRIRPNKTNRYNILKPGHYLKLSVCDTGSGIPADIIEKIFEPYYTTKGPGEGTGMGLAMVHGIVKKYHGDIMVKSQPGKGTIFHILIPAVNAKFSTVMKQNADISGGKERTLIVDDEKVIVDVMQQFLERLGYKVTIRTSSIEALEVFRNKPDEFDLVITDMTMPNMTGKDLAKRLMAIKPGIPIILCTGFSEQIDEEEARWMGIDAFVMKPIHVHEISKAIRNVLNKKRLSPKS